MSVKSFVACDECGKEKTTDMKWLRIEAHLEGVWRGQDACGIAPGARIVFSAPVKAKETREPVDLCSIDCMCVFGWGVRR